MQPSDLVLLTSDYLVPIFRNLSVTFTDLKIFENTFFTNIIGKQVERGAAPRFCPATTPNYDTMILNFKTYLQLFATCFFKFASPYDHT